VLAGKKDEIVGAHMVGARAGEMLGELALAMQHKLTLNDILTTIHAYPTINTGIQQAVFEAYLEGEALAGTSQACAYCAQRTRLSEDTLLLSHNTAPVAASHSWRHPSMVGAILCGRPRN